ncbi:acyl carrier protein [Actinomadura formosensis]|uniref:acyl carrier protein n=1 Tax=Actinomadura formosensis TaxID=60706 RepID=UPI000831C746|nr:acyl carrier protein [Actinomadura formosensis]
MSAFTLEDLKAVMRSAAGEDESLNLDGDILGVDFAALGYDSLALMEAASRLQRDLGVELPEEEVADAATPAAFLTLVNDRLAEAGTAR